MKINIRKNVFETNSSSMHSIVVDGDDKYVSLDEISSKDEYKVFPRDDMKFGWGTYELKGLYNKVCYAIMDKYYEQDMGDDTTKVGDILRKVLKEIADVLGVKEIKIARIDYDSIEDIDEVGYIDHQSIGTLVNYLQKNNIDLKEFLTNDKYTLLIDNDNHYYNEEDLLPQK